MKIMIKDRIFNPFSFFWGLFSCSAWQKHAFL